MVFAVDIIMCQIIDWNLRRMDHPNQPRRAAGVVAVHDVTVRVGQGGGGLVGHAGEEGCHASINLL